MTCDSPPPTNDLTVTSWHKSSYSGAVDNCVELGSLTNGRQAIRDSKDTRGPILAFSRNAWGAFVDSLK